MSALLWYSVWEKVQAPASVRHMERYRFRPLRATLRAKNWEAFRVSDKPELTIVYLREIGRRNVPSEKILAVHHTRDETPASLKGRWTTLLAWQGAGFPVLPTQIFMFAGSRT